MFDDKKKVTLNFEPQYQKIKKEIEALGDLSTASLVAFCEMVTKLADLWKAINTARKDFIDFDNKFEILQIAIGEVNVTEYLKAYRVE